MASSDETSEIERQKRDLEEQRQTIEREKKEWQEKIQHEKEQFER